jgi:hypothetical protein
MSHIATLLSKSKYIGLIGTVYNYKHQKMKFSFNRLKFEDLVDESYCLILGYSKEAWNNGVYTYLDDKGLIHKSDPYGSYPKIKIHKK